MVLKMFFRKDTTQITAISIIGSVLLINPVGHLFGLNNSSYDEVKVVKHGNDFLKCQNSTPDKVSMGGVKTKAQSTSGVVALYTNPTVSDYYGFLCLEIAEGKNTTNTISLKPHPKLDNQQLIAFSTIDPNNIPVQWRKSSPFSSIRAF
jgi:hypothetical protein